MSTCLDYALKYVNRYPKTEQELITQLRKKWYPETDIETTIDQFKTLNYINDTEYARLYLTSEVVNKGKPLYLILGKLNQKWVERNILDTLIYEMNDDLLTWMKTKILTETKKLQDKDQDILSIIQKLQRRWYSFDLIKEALQDIQ